MPSAKETDCTIKDIYELKDGKRAELIGGQIIMMAPPSLVHQDVTGRLYSAILQHISKENGKCRTYISPFAVFLNGEDTYVEPDVVVVCDSDKLDNDGCHGAPEWVIEVVSPSSRRMDYYTKLVLYRDAGVKEYWIADPAKETVLVYLMEENEAPTIYRFADLIPVGLLDGLKICMTDLLNNRI